MGAWGVSLYSSDDALDLRASIRAVCRLPHSGDELVELLADLNSDARDPGKEGHSMFWLVVADQFQRRGIRSVARQRALDVIADGTDLAMYAKLGMADRDLRKRKRLLDALGDQLRSLPPERSWAGNSGACLMRWARVRNQRRRRPAAAKERMDSSTFARDRTRT